MYDLVGDFAAMQFFQINPTNGAVSVRRSLVEDRAYAPSYQVRVLDFYHLIYMRSQLNLRWNLNRQLYKLKYSVWLQLVIVAYDDKFPYEKTEGKLTVNVNRNDNPPIPSQVVQVTVSEDFTLGGVITEFSVNTSSSRVRQLLIDQF